MKKVRSSLLAGLSLAAALSIPALCAAPMGCKKAPTSQPEQSAPEKPTTELMQRTWDAWSTLDPQKAAPFYAKDEGLVFFDFAPLQYRGWNAYENGVKKLLAQFSTMKAKVRDDTRIEAHGNHALVAGIVHFDVTFQDGMTESFDARWSVVWEWREGQWLIIHEHLSVPIHDGPPEAEPPQGG
ncbi:YybH family protein [Polyangium jinanense]|uniref:Nuclear transport factor 2 family protein n=1 Tax=Polyangium jinanense TaxID=2829994 RepID=A0A9X4AYT5_9BACT|nr:nuclear transport factor 2 family protein [Polyangium jinanense]MDC3961037.1 nuclear transport factor 2 family protein [Polyangium jinanense]MDC3987457.1 nuclear transport factor 2 family protein [Polyangium jinanense]